MSGAAAGRVFVFDPEDRLDPAQYHGNVLEEITAEEWRDVLAPFVAAEAAKRGAPIRVEGDELVIRLDGEWRRWRYDDCFIQLVPQKVSRRLAKRGVTPPQLAPARRGVAASAAPAAALRVARPARHVRPPARDARRDVERVVAAGDERA